MQWSLNVYWIQTVKTFNLPVSRIFSEKILKSDNNKNIPIRTIFIWPYAHHLFTEDIFKGRDFPAHICCPKQQFGKIISKDTFFFFVYRISAYSFLPWIVSAP